jgi:hypothetical protein
MIRTEINRVDISFLGHIFALLVGAGAMLGIGGGCSLFDSCDHRVAWTNEYDCNAECASLASGCSGHYKKDDDGKEWCKCED